jgi:hypothetical protein
VLPPLAQIALEEGETVANNLHAELEGKPLETFTFHDKGFVVSVGVRRGVADVAGITTGGRLAHVLKDAIEWEYRQPVRHLRVGPAGPVARQGIRLTPWRPRGGDEADHQQDAFAGGQHRDLCGPQGVASLQPATRPLDLLRPLHGDRSGVRASCPSSLPRPCTALRDAGRWLPRAQPWGHPARAAAGCRNPAAQRP